MRGSSRMHFTVPPLSTKYILYAPFAPKLLPNNVTVVPADAEEGLIDEIVGCEVLELVRVCSMLTDPSPRMLVSDVFIVGMFRMPSPFSESRNSKERVASAGMTISTPDCGAMAKLPMLPETFVDPITVGPS